MALRLADGVVGVGDPGQDVERRAGRQGNGHGALAQGGARPGARAAQRHSAEPDLGGQGAVRAAGRLAGVAAPDRARGVNAGLTPGGWCWAAHLGSGRLSRLGRIGMGAGTRMAHR